jgi:hypothetical protein
MQVNEAGGKVVAIGQARSDMRFPVIAEMQAYWEALRAGRLVPLRSEVDPRGIEQALENAFILERIAPQVARFRLAGTHLNDLMGMEVRGMPLTAFFTPAGRAEMAEHIEAVFQGPQIGDFTLTGEAGMGKPPIMARLVVLPLRSDLGDLTRALGCLVSDGQIGRAPRRFELTSVRMGAIEAGKPASRGSVVVPSALSVAVSGLAEAPVPYRTEPGQRTHLRLVKSDE